MFILKTNMYTILDNLNLTVTFNLGNEETLQGFFNSIAYHLENKEWGSVYPTIMNEFYSGKLEQKNIKKAIKEIKEIKQRLSEIDFTQMVFDMESEPDNKYLLKQNHISIDDICVNEKREKITDKILLVLKAVKKGNFPLYIGQYYYKELYNKEVADIVETTKKKQKRNTIIKYLIYLSIVIIVKLFASPEQFNDFIMKFIRSMILAEIIIYSYKQKLDNKTQEYEKQIEAKLNSKEPKMRIENITIERNYTSSIFDSILDEIDCPKDHDKIIKTLKAKKIKNWQLDIEKFHEELGYDIEYANEIIEDFEEIIAENPNINDTFEYYQIENIYKVLPKEKIENIYDENDIYRILKYGNKMNLIIFNNPKK